MAEKFFKVPFANEGDRLTVPDVIQADGSISFTQGYGFDYERDQATDPQAKDISRESFNGLLYDITSVLGDIQRTGVQHYMSEITYSKGSIVWFNEELYLSLVNSNNEDPVSETWVKINETASLEKKGIAQLTNNIDESEDKAATPKAVNTVKQKADQLPNPVENLFPVGRSSTAYRLVDAEEMKTLLNIPNPVDVVQTTGESTEDVMSQKAVTDAINALNVDYALVDFGTINVTGKFFKKANPFGNVPVLTVTEIKLGEKWTTYGWFEGSTGGDTYGVFGGFTSTGLVIRAGSRAIVPTIKSSSALDEGVDESKHATSAPARMHVWRLKK